MLRSETQNIGQVYIACQTEVRDGLVWPKMKTLECEPGCTCDPVVVYAGNAHVEADANHIRSCSTMHPDGDSGCVACEVEAGTAVAIQWPIWNDGWKACSRRCLPGHIDDDCWTHTTTPVQQLHQALGDLIAHQGDQADSGDVRILLDVLMPHLTRQEQPLAEWEKELLQASSPLVGDRVRLTITGRVTRKSVQSEGFPTLYQIDTSVVGDDGQWVTVQHGCDVQVTLVNIEKGYQA